MLAVCRPTLGKWQRSATTSRPASQARPHRPAPRLALIALQAPAHPIRALAALTPPRPQKVNIILLSAGMARQKEYPFDRNGKRAIAAEGCLCLYGCEARASPLWCTLWICLQAASLHLKPGIATELCDA